MQILSLILFFGSIRLLLGRWITQEQFEDILRYKPKVTRTAASRKVGAISSEKCQEYKNLVTEEYSVGSSFMSDDYSRKIIKEVKCKSGGGLIYGGQEAYPGEFPHMAAIGWRKSKRQVVFKCGGSLISERFVITVAHCSADEEGRQPSFVRLGDQNLASSNDGAQPADYSIEEVIKHGDYNPRSKENDIALVKLRDTVKFNAFVRPACLHTERYFKGDVIATGWGKYTNSKTSDELLMTSLKTVDSETCFSDVKDELNVESILPSQVCAGGEKNEDTCDGDSGGPIQAGHPDASCVYDVIGLTSFGPAICGSKIPAVYTRVSFYIEWIEKIVWASKIQVRDNFVMK